jgi:hypothetical protein
MKISKKKQAMKILNEILDRADERGHKEPSLTSIDPQEVKDAKQLDIWLEGMSRMYDQLLKESK